MAIEELVFSCSICQATVSDVYSSTESDKGFVHSSGDDKGIVTKMWVAECSHITCAKHLDGGGKVSSPSSEETPANKAAKLLHSTQRAVSRERHVQDVSEPTAIEASRICSVSEAWQRGSMIQSSRKSGANARQQSSMSRVWRLSAFSIWVSPEKVVKSTSADISAAICHYARKIRKRHKDALNKQRSMEAAYSKERKQRRQLQTEHLASKSQLSDLENTRAKLEMWEKRKPKIFHYLGVFSEMLKFVYLHVVLCAPADLGQ